MSKKIYKLTGNAGNYRMKTMMTAATQMGPELGKQNATMGINDAEEGRKRKGEIHKSDSDEVKEKGTSEEGKPKTIHHRIYNFPSWGMTYIQYIVSFL
jgi:hypothetical protein